MLLSRQRLKEFVFGVALPAALSVIATAAVIFVALTRMATEVNEIDNNHMVRSVEAVQAAILEQVGRVSQDYGVWTDAYAALSGTIDEAFVRENLVAGTASGTMFDLAAVLDPEGLRLIGFIGGKRYAAGTKMVEAADTAVLVAAAAAEGEAGKPATGIIRTAAGPAFAAVERLLPSSGPPPPGDPPRYLMVARLATDTLLNDLGAAYGAEGLHIRSDSDGAAGGLAVRSAGGDILGWLTWHARNPGLEAYDRAWQPMLVVLAMLSLVMAFLVLTIWKIMSAMQVGEETALRDARHDRLSGLPNRASFHDGLDDIWLDEVRPDVTVVFVDLDGFKEVNDTYGHEVGDRLIRAVAAGFRCLVGENGMLARLGGDEFAVVLRGQGSQEAAMALGAGMIEFLQQPFDFEGRMVKVGSSIGIAATLGEPVSSIELVRRADVAMYEAKARGKNRITLYSSDLDADRADKVALTLALRDALQREELQLHYQPVVNSRTGRVTAVEALIRWIRPGTGPVSPSIFLPLAEEAGITEPLGAYVLRRACRDALRFGNVKLVVNLFGSQFKNPLFDETLARILEEERFPPERLELDITESYLIAYPDRAQRMIEALHRLGVRVALDDFGTGFSSISYLRRFSFDKVKIDRSVIIDVVKDPASQQLVQSTVALADALGVEVTAEGIERKDEADMLRQAGCHELQGYHFGSPTVANEIVRRLDSETSRVRRSA